jgi:hypothetical protein
VPLIRCTNSVSFTQILDHNQEITLQREWNRTLIRRKSEGNRKYIDCERQKFYVLFGITEISTKYEKIDAMT